MSSPAPQSPQQFTAQPRAPIQNFETPPRNVLSPASAHGSCPSSSRKKEVFSEKYSCNSPSFENMKNADKSFTSPESYSSKTPKSSHKKVHAATERDQRRSRSRINSSSQGSQGSDEEEIVPKSPSQSRGDGFLRKGASKDAQRNDRIARRNSLSGKKSSPGVKLQHRQRDIQKEDLGTSSALGGYLTLAAMLSVGVAGAGYALHNRNFIEDRSSQSWGDLKKEFRAKLEKEIRPLFPTQPGSTFRDVFLALTSGMQEKPQHPGLVVLLTGPNGKATSSCLTQKLVQATASYFSGSGDDFEQYIVDGDDFSSSQGKAKFHDSLHDRLSKYGVAAIKGLEKLSGDTAIVLHGFADDSVAPFKQSVLVMTLADELEVAEVSDPSWRAEKLLLKYWSDLGTDKSSALITRVTVSVVRVLPESAQVISQACH